MKKRTTSRFDHDDVFQNYNDVSVIGLKPKKPSQLGYRRFFDPATQDEHSESPSCLSLNPKSHRSGQLANIAVAALCAALISSIREQLHVVQTSVQLDFTENRGEKEIRVTESWECARILGVQRAYRIVCFLMLRCLIFRSSVDRGIPSLAAAPFGPATIPLLSVRAASISSFS
jgi:hypothetical protein